MKITGIPRFVAFHLLVSICWMSRQALRYVSGARESVVFTDEIGNVLENMLVQAAGQRNDYC